MARILIGKLWEGWQLLQKYFFGAKLSKDYDSLLSEKEKNYLSNLKKYFAKDNLIKNMRNDFSFHYSAEAMKKIFWEISENDPDNCQIYIGDNIGNSLFFVSEYVINNALLESILPGNQQEAMDKLFKESTEVARLFTEVISGCMNVIAEKYLLNENGQLDITAVDIGSVQAMDDIHIPYFVSAPHAP